MTEDADPFDTVWRRVEKRIDGHLVVAHNTTFDMYVLRESAAWCEFTPAEFDFLCTYRLAKVTWPQMFSYSLDVLAEELGIELEQHHHAAHDELAAGLLAAKICEANQTPTLLEAAKTTGFKLGRFSMAAYKPFSSAKTTGGGRYGEQFRFKDLVPAGEVDESHPVHGVCFAFTGTLSSMTRKEAAQRVVDAGGEAHAGPTKTTNFLVVGMTDFTKVRDGMSGKMKKALDLADAGTGIEIIDEREFLQMFV